MPNFLDLCFCLSPHELATAPDRLGCAVRNGGAGLRTADTALNSSELVLLSSLGTWLTHGTFSEGSSFKCLEQGSYIQCS